MDQISDLALPYNAAICRYDEIAMKGRNRVQFESILISGIRRALEKLGPVQVIRERGRIFLRPQPPKTIFQGSDRDILATGLTRVTGLSSASPGFLVTPDLPAIEQVIAESLPLVYQSVASRIPEPGQIRYRMRARRNNKSFPMTCIELETYFAERFLPHYPRLTVDLRNSDLCFNVEIRAKRAFVWYEHIPGPGGLPSGVSGRVLVLLSGGIDSPVAAYQLMKRGCNVDFVTFHSAPYTPPELITKVSRLVRVLNNYQTPGRLVAVNLLPAQTAIRERCRDRFRTILYRRFMVRLATVIAQSTGAGALGTGDTLGQVASQTMENLAVVSELCPLIVLRPLLTFDKLETVALAQKIDTFGISREDVPDSCTVFAPANPATATTHAQAIAEEHLLDLPSLLRECLHLTVAVDPATFEQTPLPHIEQVLEECLPSLGLPAKAAAMPADHSTGNRPGHAYC